MNDYGEMESCGDVERGQRDLAVWHPRHAGEWQVRSRLMPTQFRAMTSGLMSKLNDFLTKEKIDHRRLRSASKKEEALRPEDRAVRLARRAVRGEGQATDTEKELAAKAVRSGRPVAPPTLQKALRGDKVSSAAKARITRAVNRVLKARKKSEVAAADLF